MPTTTSTPAEWGAILANAIAQVLYCSAQVGEIFRGDRAPLLAGATLLTPETAKSHGGSAAAQPQPCDTATVQYSSGATGIPKGILLTHRAMLNNIRAMRDGLGLKADDVSVNWIPLYHDMGLLGALLLPMLCGCPTVLIPTMDFMRDPGLWLWAVHRYRGAISWAPNFAYNLVASRVPEAELDGLDLSSWRIAINAAEPLLARTVETFSSRFAPYGLRPEATTPAWGLAETVMMATAHPVEEVPRIEHIDRRALAARALAKPTGPDGVSSLADRSVGAVWLRSDSLLTGYNRDEKLTAQVLVDGWLDTGDRGYQVEGDLFFVSREKDLIVIGGEKYPPHDLEILINEVPGVRAGCAVCFGVLNEAHGTEEIAAVVETRETGEAATALDRAIRQKVLQSTGLALRHVLLVPPGGVEKTTSGKLARRATRQRHADQLP